MGQTPLAETKGNPFAFNVLLTDTGDNLGHVDVGALAACHHHHLEVVELCQRPLGGATTLLPSVVQDPVDLVLKSLPDGVTRGWFQLVLVCLQHHLPHLHLGRLDGVDDVLVGARIGNGVADADAVALVEQPVVDNSLDVAVEITIQLMTTLELTKKYV